MATTKAQVFTYFYINKFYHSNSFSCIVSIFFFGYDRKLYALSYLVLEYPTLPQMSQHGLFIKNNSWLWDNQGIAFRASNARTYFTQLALTGVI